MFDPTEKVTADEAQPKQSGQPDEARYAVGDNLICKLFVHYNKALPTGNLECGHDHE